MNRTIILPTDFSQNARSAYSYAFNLFGFKNVQYILLNTYKILDTGVDMLVAINNNISLVSMRGLEKELQYCQTEFQNVDQKVKVCSIYGNIETINFTRIQKLRLCPTQ